jgi:hypothetical protein
MLKPDTYIATLKSLEGNISQHNKTPYVRLNFITKEPVEQTAVRDGKQITTLEKTLITCTLFGTIAHVIAWRELVERDFKVRVRHETHKEVVYIHADVLGIVGL